MRCLQENECTYAESDEILEMLIEQIEFQKEQFEYDTVTDFFNGKKARSLDNEIIVPLNEAALDEI